MSILAQWTAGATAQEILEGGFAQLLDNVTDLYNRNDGGDWQNDGPPEEVARQIWEEITR